MDKVLFRIACIAAVLMVTACCSKAAPAVPTCPPLCLLPPDPAPPMPPINVPDPPFKPVAPTNPNHNGGHGAASAGQAVSVMGTMQAGAECRSGNLSGTVVIEGGRRTCNFMPSTLSTDSACHDQPLTEPVPESICTSIAVRPRRLRRVRSKRDCTAD